MDAKRYTVRGRCGVVGWSGGGGGCRDSFPWIDGDRLIMAKQPAKAPESSNPTPSPLAPPPPPPPPPAKLDDAQIEAALKKAPEWSELGGTIQRTFQFKNFVESMTFVRQVAGIAESDQHHPDILIRYNKVTLTLSTHDSGGITGKDFDAAAKYDVLLGSK